MQAQQGKDVPLTYHISPGTSHMAAVWVILAKTRFPAELIDSSLQEGVKTVSFPFEIFAEFIPDLLKPSDRRLAELSEGLPAIWTAVPVAIAMDIGRVRMPKADLPLHIYDQYNDRGFQFALIVG